MLLIFSIGYGCGASFGSSFTPIDISISILWLVIIAR